MSKHKVWECKIVVPANTKLPSSFDGPLRQAVIKTIYEYNMKLLGCFSGWNGKLEPEQEKIIDREIKLQQAEDKNENT